jgi:hypothetical protein
MLNSADAQVPIELDADFVTECNNMCNSFVWFIRETVSNVDHLSPDFRRGSRCLCPPTGLPSPLAPHCILSLVSPLAAEEPKRRTLHSARGLVRRHQMPCDIPLPLFVPARIRVPSAVDASTCRVQEDFMGAQFDIVHAHDWLAAKTIVQASFRECGENGIGGMRGE